MLGGGPRGQEAEWSSQSAAAEYLQVVSGGEHKTKKVMIKGSVHPSVSRARDIITAYSENLCLTDQNILGWVLDQVAGAHP